MRTSGPRSNKQLEATYRTDMSYIRLDAICHTHIVLFCLVLILSRYDRERERDIYVYIYIYIEVKQTFTSIVNSSFGITAK